MGGLVGNVLVLLLGVCLALGQETLPEVSTSKQETFSLEDITSRYYSNEELAEFMVAFTSKGKCSDISRMFSIGKSVEGRELWVLEVSSSAGKNDGKPNFKYIANMHGDETGGRQLMIGLARWLCDNYQTNDKARRIVEGMHMYLMPTMNPDGFANGPSRNNRNDRDLNRNFPDRLRDGLPLVPNGFEEPETKAVMDWTLSNSFVASANLHSGAVVANYPWDASADGSSGIAASPDQETFVHISSVYANSHKFMAASREFPKGITNGNQWYPISGGMQDWNYVAADCLEITLELSEQKDPPPSTLQQHWKDNKEALLDYALETVFGGVCGNVISVQTGKPLVATIAVEGIDKNISSSPSFGQFCRPLAPGKYIIRATADEYQSESLEIVVPEKLGEGARANFRLQTVEQSTGEGIVLPDAENALKKSLVTG